MAKEYKVYTPAQKGALACRAGCTPADYPDGLTTAERIEWQEGFEAEHKIQQSREEDIYRNDLGKFGTDPTGGM